MKLTFTHFCFFIALLIFLPLPRVFAQNSCFYAENLAFGSWTQESGYFGGTGSVYRFSDVMANTDALVKIRRKYNARITSLDNGNTGDANAFQPTVKISRQSYYGTYGFVDFEITFVDKGTTTPVQITDWRASAIDVDGDSYRLREAAGFVDCDRYTLERNTLLDVNTYDLEDKTVYFFSSRRTETAAGIDVDATENMVYMEFSNRTSFVYRAAIIDNGGYSRWSSASSRMFSLNFTPCLINNFTVPQTIATQQFFPVEWVEFQGAVAPGRVELNWTTSNEVNNQQFVVQRSVDGNLFESIASIQPKGGEDVLTTYEFTDRSARKGVNYYRILQVDVDGTLDYSSTIEVTAEDLTQPMMTVLGNPVSDRLVVDLNAPVSGKFVVLDAQGRVFYEKVVTDNFAKIDLDVSGLASGVYWMHFQTELEQRVSRAFTIK